MCKNYLSRKIQISNYGTDKETKIKEIIQENMKLEQEIIANRFKLDIEEKDLDKKIKHLMKNYVHYDESAITKDFSYNIYHIPEFKPYFTNLKK